MKEFVNFDEFYDVQASLTSLLQALESVNQQPLLWKQVILSTHSALQGSCACILTRTDGGGALDKNSEERLYWYHKNQTDIAIAQQKGAETPEEMVYPQLEMQGLPGLLRRLPDNLTVDIPKNFENCSDADVQDFWRLHDWRNSFTHFQIIDWSIEIAGLPRIVLNALQLIEKIILSDSYHRRNRFYDTDVSDLLLRCTRACEKL
ncbi:hypothetical protein [uncultured Tateyamaria sp.]|uniref:hypothetical protein n=1 Tax=uncultured Tateyamaria sp. TaxID=455651 RepID=UPI00261FD99E|nr:hypothetical protein [uncultured Tateyamaria sp.]